MPENPFNKFPQKKKPEKSSIVNRAAQAIALAAGIGVVSESVKEYDNYLHPDKAPESYSASVSPFKDKTQGLYTVDTAQPESKPEQAIEQEISNLAVDRSPRPEHRPLSLDQFESVSDLYTWVVQSEAQRLQVDPVVFSNRIDEFITMIADMESDHKQDAQNPHADRPLSFFQFKTANNDENQQNSSLHVAVNRLDQLLNRTDLGTLDQSSKGLLEWAQDVYDNPEKLVDISYENQRLLLFADLIQKTGSDNLLTALLSNDSKEVKQAALTAYYKLHNIYQDDATIQNATRDVEKYFNDLG